MEIGKPSSGGGSRKKNYFKVTQGSSVFRILPPMGNLAKAGVWSKYYEVHFGYENVDDYMRPFQTCEVKSRDRKMIEIDDPATERIKKLKSQLVAVQERNKTNPSDALEAKIEELQTLVGFPAKFNLDKRHYVNAMNEKGEIGLLGLKHKEKLALEDARAKLKKEDGVDPVGFDGAFIEFTKSGKAFDTIVQVSGHSIVSKGTDGKNVRTLNTHSLDDTLINRLADEAFELDNLFIALTREEIKTIVKASEAGEEKGKKAVSAVFEKYQPSKSAKTEAKTVEKVEVVEEKVVAKTVTKSTPKATVKAAPKVEETLSMDEEATSEETKEASAAVVANQSQSDDDFLASIGVPR